MSFETTFSQLCSIYEMWTSTSHEKLPMAMVYVCESSPPWTCVDSSDSCHFVYKSNCMCCTLGRTTQPFSIAMHAHLDYTPPVWIRLQWTDPTLQTQSSFPWQRNIGRKNLFVSQTSVKTIDGRSIKSIGVNNTYISRTVGPYHRHDLCCSFGPDALPVIYINTWTARPLILPTSLYTRHTSVCQRVVRDESRVPWRSHLAGRMAQWQSSTFCSSIMITLLVCTPHHVPSLTPRVHGYKWSYTRSGKLL